MNFNLIKIRLKIMFYLIFGKISKKSAKINFPNHKDIKRAILYFPSNEEAFRVAMYSFRDFDFFNKDIDYYFVINQKFENLIKLNGPNLIFLRYNRNNVTFCSLMDKEKLMDKKQDILIDLNTEFNLELCRLINDINCHYKVGFKSDFSDYFFNLQLDTYNDNISENSFKRIQQILM